MEMRSINVKEYVKLIQIIQIIKIFIWIFLIYFLFTILILPFLISVKITHSLNYLFFYLKNFIFYFHIFYFYFYSFLFYCWKLKTKKNYCKNYWKYLLLSFLYGRFHIRILGLFYKGCFFNKIILVFYF